MPGTPVKTSPSLSLLGTAEKSTWMAWTSSSDGGKVEPNSLASILAPLSPGCCVSSNIPAIPMGASFEAFANSNPPWPTTPTPSPSNKPRRSPRIGTKKKTDGPLPKPCKKPTARAKQTKEKALRRRVDVLQEKNKTLRKQKWDLENEITVLKAKIMTDEEEMRSVDDMEKRLDHSRRYIRALKMQVRALGGYVIDVSDEDGESSNDSGDGELPASFPRAAANPSEFSLPALRAKRSGRQKTRS
ncbi:hypothetical protein CMQ_2491 [Grosmannia clavigera kw1407]|uniref:Uncharacterized protein n=1 Tax=Grosmannia clavigera (strain kw1407 / UAMH 11150) TaxID=655863 RepID=F0XJV6_GROCL|nr:uncharacterized protein CMQ_2491 [Grosmannia clavigera kw1407]EFX02442.1 hypothetical protein CMQ_2491 [Grosmannia clavigera kw1407]